MLQNHLRKAALESKLDGRRDGKSYAVDTPSTLEQEELCPADSSLRIKLTGSDLSEDDIRNMLAAAGLKIAGAHVAVSDAGTLRDMTLDLLEFSKPTEVRSPAIFAAVAARKDVVLVEWRRM
jgi:hypothetical protein